jgi:signal transduction histidine kinase
VLQVLALVQRQGSELGDRGSRLAELAGEQEVALRSLLTGGGGSGGGGSGGPAGPGAADVDLRGQLWSLASPGVEVATSAQPVPLPAATAAELVAAVRAALDNVREHAGNGARAWVLLEDERDGVRVTVRDDGVGFAPGRLAEAAEAGRLGVAQSMRGRISDLGGSTAIHSAPGEGTEVEFWVPRAP